MGYNGDMKKEELKKYYKKLGKKGGEATLEKYGKKQMLKWAKMGGINSGIKRKKKKLLGDNSTILA